ncbi:MAG: hypothetical protein ISR76_00765 [Planctomycetes bacterium]|nr:hypothetical protein [Planctomycetota bacterium]MBL7007503.1 hypothetical protein [Planctomycetota bacterium]
MLASAALPHFIGLALVGLRLAGGADGAAAADAGSVVAMNPFGAAFVAVTWAVLVGLNFWCLRKLLKHRNPS